MLPGYDCPHEAVFLPATTHTAVGSITRERAICVFEHDTGRPITRHTGYMSGEFGAVKGYVLVVRSISTVGKYVAYPSSACAELVTDTMRLCSYDYCKCRITVTICLTRSEA